MDKKKPEEHLDDFMYAIYESIRFWDEQSKTSKEKLEGLSFSILCILDGVCCSFDSDIHALSELGDDFYFHDYFYEYIKKYNGK